jgi:hypothetical protein
LQAIFFTLYHAVCPQDYPIRMATYEGLELRLLARGVESVGYVGTSPFMQTIVDIRIDKV